MNRCSLCSRDFSHRDVRNSPNGYLCEACWAVISPQPWPKDDSAHGGAYASPFANGGATRPDGHAAMTAKAAAQEAADAANAAHRATMQRRSQSVANLAGMAVPTNQRRAHPTLPHSMPEHPGILSGSADSYRFGGLGQHQAAASAPAWRNGVLAVPEAAPPTFSPVELRNMMHEESLELFESQSHLLDPESRAALQRQRQYLQWQNSLEEPGLMQSALERQDSAGSGCNDDDLRQGMGGHYNSFAAAATVAGHGNANGGTFNIVVNGGSAEAHSGDTDSGGNGAVSLRHDLQEARRHLAVVSREREALTTRVQQLEAELQAQREATLCKMCHRRSRNCVVLPCLHFTSCDTCFKKHCASTLCCPSCNSRVTGFQTLLVL